MQGIFLSIIAVSQLFGALFAFAGIDAIIRQVPISTMPWPAVFNLGWFITVFLLGLIGAMLIWLKRHIGIWLSLIHQLAIVPLFLIPNVFFYVLGDGISVVLAISVRGANVAFVLKANIGSGDVLSLLAPVAGTGYYGVNLFALICAIYLYKLLGRIVSGQAEAT